MKSFSQYLVESVKDDMMDISIKDISKDFDTTKKIQKLLDTKVTIFEKYDGTKLTLVRNDAKWSPNYEDNWIVAFKGNILYPEEFGGIKATNQIVKSSIGTSQYALIHKHLKKVHSKTKDIPTNTEFFIEYLMNKPTLTRDYTHKHGMILLAWSPTRFSVTNGKLKTVSSQFNVKNREKFAKELGLNVPRVLYDKKPLGGFVTGSFDTPEQKLLAIKEKLLAIDSEFGGKTEGVVIQLLPNGGIYKFLQNDQHDDLVRSDKKSRYKMSQEEESKYYESIRKIVEPMVDKVDKKDLKTSLGILSHEIYSMKNLPKHDKKEPINVQDDMFLTAKTSLIKRMEGNNGALFSGRFSPPTKAHIAIIEDALKKYDTVTLNIVKSGKLDEKNPFPYDLQEKIWRSVFPKLTIQSTNTGNLITALKKAENNINVVLTGTDRLNEYKSQLAANPDIKVVEIKRTTEDISATKARNAIKNNNRAEFEKNMDRRTWKFYDELKKYVG